MEKYRICVACASGMATSHLIMEQLKEMFEKAGVAVDISATRVGDLGTDPNFDIIVTSTLLKAKYKCPVYTAISFLTGVGIPQEFQEILKILQKSGREA